MAVPRNRQSNARKNKRRSHHAKTAKNILKCNNCEGPVLSHTICQTCGYYGQEQVLSVG